MGLGSLATIGVQKPDNLAIVVFDNGLYGETGMQESHTSGGVDLLEVARGCGIERVMDVEDEAGLKELAGLLRDVRRHAVRPRPHHAGRSAARAAGKGRRRHQGPRPPRGGEDRLSSLALDVGLADHLAPSSADFSRRCSRLNVVGDIGCRPAAEILPAVLDLRLGSAPALICAPVREFGDDFVRRLRRRADALPRARTRSPGSRARRRSAHPARPRRASLSSPRARAACRP